MRMIHSAACALLLSAWPAFAAVTVTSPQSGATVTSPVSYVATATTTTCARGVASMGIYVDYKKIYVVQGTNLNTSISLAPGSYNTTVEEWDKCGGASVTHIPITVSSSSSSGGSSKSAVTVTMPAPNSTVTSPVSYAATATTTCSKGVASMGIYVNNVKIYVVQGAALNTSISLATGAEHTVVEEWDKCGGAATTTINLTVAAPKTLKSVTVTPANPSITAGTTQQFTATATYSDGSTANVTPTATWMTSNTGVATVASGGLAKGIAAGSTQVTATLSGVTGTDTLTVTAATLKSIAVTPANPSIATGATQQFTATATYSDGSTADVTSSATWVTANTAVATIASGGLATGVAAGSTQVTATASSVSGNDTLTITAPPSGGVNITTWHVDNNRSGLNDQETSLSPANVTSQTFGKLFSYLIDGYAYAEPLVMSNVTVNGALHNVVYVATEHDSVYAFDADNYGTGAPLWQVSLLQSGETPLTGAQIQPFQGVTSTPVIDPTTGTLYVVSAQTSSSTGSSYRLNALDITTGAQKFGGAVTIQASVPGTNATAVNGVVSLPKGCVQRTALLLANGNVYMGFGNCHEGWVLGYNATTLAQVGAFNVSPNLDGEGQFASAGGVWMGSAGPVADSNGNIYVSTGNGPWDGQTAFSDSVLKLSPTLALEDYFTSQDYAYLNCHDGDLAAGGLVMIPGSSNLVGGGKQGLLFLVSSSNLGQEQANNAGIVQSLYFEGDISAPYSSTCTDASGSHTANLSSYEIFGTAAYYNGSIYLGITPTASGVPAGIRQFVYSGGKLSYGAETSPSIQMNTRGTTPFISSDGTANGVLWMIDTGLPLQLNSSPTNATLRAYDPDDLGTELYNSSENTADIPGYGIRFTSPVVVNGKVYISTGHDLPSVSNPLGELDVYGLK